MDDGRCLHVVLEIRGGEVEIWGLHAAADWNCGGPDWRPGRPNNSRRNLSCSQLFHVSTTTDPTHSFITATHNEATATTSSCTSNPSLHRIGITGGPLRAPPHLALTPWG